MATLDEEVQALKQRVERLEQEMAASRKKEKSAHTWKAQKKPAPAMDLPTAQQVLEGVLPALLAVAQARQEAQVLVAFADQKTASGGGPSPVGWLLRDEFLEPLTRLGAAVSNPSRARLLQALRRQGECATAALATASGLGGGNLYQQLNELHAANLIYQPKRGSYRLTAGGRFAVDVLFFAALQVRSDPARIPGQGTWFGAPETEESE